MGSDPQQGLALRVLGAWGDLRGSLRWLLAQRPSETTLYVFFALSGLALFMAALANYVLSGGGPLTGEAIAGFLVTGFIVFGLIWPLTGYLLALIGHGLARAFGGTGSGHASRAAMAWAALVASPVLVVASLGGLAIAQAVPPGAADLIRSAGLVAFFVALAPCFAEAHGFSRAWPVVAVAALLLVALLGALGLATG
ncbi:MAG: hypothetical protein ACFBRM_11790 [Pikeienuella sp.]